MVFIGRAGIGAKICCLSWVNKKSKRMVRSHVLRNTKITESSYYDGVFGRVCFYMYLCSVSRLLSGYSPRSVVEIR